MRRAALRHDETGIALIAVMIIGAILMLLVGATLTFAMGSLNQSRRDQDWNAALSAAEAGIDDYIFRLNRDGTYWLYNAASPPPDGNMAFTQLVPVPGGASDSMFRYDVNASQIQTNGTVTITSTGRVRNTTRTVRSILRRNNFLDYLYFTEYETLDPELYTGSPFSAATAQTLCKRHYYDIPPRDSRCTEISFFTRDIIRGPLHSNDAILISGNPQFRGNTSTSWSGASGRRWRGSGSPTFVRSGDPRLAPPLTIPPSNTAIKAETDPSTGATGCLFTGPTKITLNSSGTMSVVSPFTRSSNCGVGLNMPLPANGVIYVQAVPTAPTDPNYTANPLSLCPTSNGFSSVNRVGYPIRGDITRYGCADGDVFVSGTLKGRLTIASANKIIVTGNTTYSTGTTGSDLLGLVADTYVEVYHPYGCNTFSPSASNNCNESSSNYSDLTGSLTNLQIYAAILSVKHSFRVQNYNLGTPKGALTVVGAIAQEYRGIVGTFSGSSTVTGYEKDYVYDQRLKYLSPPSFLDPVKSAWGSATYEERRTPAAYLP